MNLFHTFMSWSCVPLKFISCFFLLFRCLPIISSKWMYDVNLLHFYSLAIDWKLHIADKNIFCLPVSKQFDNPPLWWAIWRTKSHLSRFLNCFFFFFALRWWSKSTVPAFIQRWAWDPVESTSTAHDSHGSSRHRGWLLPSRSISGETE